MMIDPITAFMLQFAWGGMLAGVLSGAVIGLFFHREDWMGGYDSFRRRLTRLGHISFFGLGFINFFFAITHHIVGLTPACARVAAWAFAIGAVTMPAVCFLTAWKKPWRRLFPIPVLAVATGIIATLVGSANQSP
jgi:hypothetical protein